jgi:hypothetical protein
MNVPFPLGLFDDPVVLEATQDQRWALVLSYRHIVNRTNRQPSPGTWVATDGAIKRPVDKGQESAIFGGYATFDEMVSAGLVVKHPVQPGMWMPYGFPRDAEAAYVSNATKAPGSVKARAKFAATAVTAVVTTAVTTAVSGVVIKRREEKTGVLSKSEVGTTSEAPPPDDAPDASYDPLTGEMFEPSVARVARSGGDRR